MNISKQSMQPKKTFVRQHQTGAALIWGLVILLSLTVFGVVAARMGVVDNRIAGNEIFGMMTYQAAESQLNKIRPAIQQFAPEGSLSLIKDTVTSANKTLMLKQDSGYLLADANTTSTVQIAYGGKMTMCAPQEFGMSVEMQTDAGRLDCHRFTVKSSAFMPGTGARSQHEIGLMSYQTAGYFNLP